MTPGHTTVLKMLPYEGLIDFCMTCWNSMVIAARWPYDFVAFV